MPSLAATDATRHPTRARRRARMAALLAAILMVVSGASLVVHGYGVRTLEARAEEKLEDLLHGCRATISERLDDMASALELALPEPLVLQILDADLGNDIHHALKSTLEKSPDLFTTLTCVDVEGRVVESTEPFPPGKERALDEDMRAALNAGGRAWLARERQRLTLAVPVLYAGFDEPEVLGYVFGEAPCSALLADGRPTLSRLSANETLLAERLEHRPHDGGEPGLAGHVHAWDSPDVQVRASAAQVPRGFSDPGWTVAVADCRPDLVIGVGVLRRMGLVLTAGTAGLVVVLVLVFAWFEGRLQRRLVERARELQRLNEALDRTRSDLARAARVAGMSEVATGILHNVGTVLNNLGVAVSSVGDALSDGTVSGLRQLVEVLDGDRDGLASAVREHGKGAAFLAYLSELVAVVSGDQTRARGELACVRAAVERIEALVASHEELARPTSLVEETNLADLRATALALCDQIHGPLPGRVEGEVEDLPAVLLDKHKVLEILVQLVQNARQAMEAAEVDPVLTVEVRAAGPDRVRFEVRDNGVGIEEEDLVRVFQHGFTTREGGHGFGLHAAANAARELGGSLKAESPGPGWGAGFVLEVPHEGISEVRMAA